MRILHFLILLAHLLTIIAQGMEPEARIFVPNYPIPGVTEESRRPEKILDVIDDQGAFSFRPSVASNDSDDILSPCALRCTAGKILTEAEQKAFTFHDQKSKIKDQTDQSCGCTVLASTEIGKFQICFTLRIMCCGVNALELL
ncbi:hypothetical protein PRIPAC_76206, partial [Pristionchus pacificus]|uniref:Uncharacterized protein n=1 Tax=Pristionchus pacificus TaxID=54126 RepID=A0A2A6C6V8_PRIPA